jgi:hypothetical protein
MGSGQMLPGTLLMEFEVPLQHWNPVHTGDSVGQHGGAQTSRKHIFTSNEEDWFGRG